MALPRNYDAKAVEENGKRVLSALQPALKDHGQLDKTQTSDGWYRIEYGQNM